MRVFDCLQMVICRTVAIMKKVISWHRIHPSGLRVPPQECLVIDRDTDGVLHAYDELLRTVGRCNDLALADPEAGIAQTMTEWI